MTDNNPKMIESILDEAARITSKDRNEAYGPPSQNHRCTSSLWRVYLTRRREAASCPALTDAVDVCILNILQKISRFAHSRRRDNLVDIAGWARNAEVILDEADGWPDDEPLV